MAKVKFTEDQKRVVEHNDGNILVSASAGSGKTHTMISRLIRLITEGKSSLKRVLALTFTESAASEMKEKLRSALIKSINETGNEKLVKELGEIASADISTIDSFCKRLVKKYFFEVGVSPDFAIADEAVSLSLKKEAVDKTFSEFYASKNQKFKSLVDKYSPKRKDDDLREIVSWIYEKCSSCENEEELFEKTLYYYTNEGYEELKKEYKLLLDRNLKKLVREVEEISQGFQDLNYLRSAEFCEALISDMQNFINGDSVYVYKTKYSIKLFSSSKMDEEGNALKELVTKSRDKLVKIIADANDCLTDDETAKERNAILSEHTNLIFSLVKRYGEIYSELKREENLLDFSDLERQTLELLKKDAVRESVKDCYDYIFLDEYQDVNGVQEAIMGLISKDNTFMVGDAKQSIYGFRGCRPEFFEEKFKKMKALGVGAEKLNENFRSAPAVIEMVNKVFSYSMTEEVYGQRYKNNAELVHGGLFDDEHQGRAELHLLIKSKNKKTDTLVPEVYDLLKDAMKEEQSDVNLTAGLVAKIVEEELNKTYYDAKEGVTKKIEYKDIAILTRDRNSKYVADLIKGLSLIGIPTVTDSKETITDYPEIRSLTSLLELTTGYYKDLPLAMLMKSPIGGFTNEELAEISLAYGECGEESKKREGFSYAVLHFAKSEKGELAEKTRAFLEYLNGIRELSAFLSAHDLLSRVIEEKNIEAYLLASKRGEQKLARVRFLLSASEGEGKNYSTKEFLRLIKTNPNTLKATIFGGEDSVKVMTIHASKGLEFPVVIVCGLEKKHNIKDQSSPILYERNHGFASKYYDDNSRLIYPTILRGVIKERIKEQTIKEELRLFYVALTRAIYSLNLTYLTEQDTRKDYFNGADKFIDYIPGNIPKTEYTEEDINVSNGLAETRKVLISEINQTEIKLIKDRMNYIYPYKSDTTLPLKTSVTEANSLNKTEYYKVEELVREYTDKTDTKKGTIAHRFLELYDFDQMPQVKEYAKKLIDNGLISSEELDEINLERIGDAINGGAFNGLKDKKLYREKRFLVNLPASEVLGVDSKEEILLQGTIDLLAVGENEAMVIDYKYSSASPEKIKERYSKQLNLYALAVEKVLGKKVVSKTVINLISGQTIEID